MDTCTLKEKYCTITLTLIFYHSNSTFQFKMSQPFVAAAAKAVTKRALTKAANKTVKSMAPAIAKAAAQSAAAAATSTLVKTALTRRPKTKAKFQPTQSRRSTRRIAPVAYTTSFAKSGKSVRISQSEIIADISPDAFKEHWWSIEKKAAEYTIYPVELSPSNISTFPWLAKVAGLFDKYRFHKLSFTFVSTRSTNTKGNVSMGVDFDAYDTLPKNIIDMSNLTKFSTSPVYVNQTLAVPLNTPGTRSWYYCADGSSGDKKTYNVGTFYLALSGVEDLTSHGYLIADYDVELRDKNPSLTTVKTEIDKDGKVSTLVNNDYDDVESDSAQYYYDNDGDTGESSDWYSFDDATGTITLSNLVVGSKVLLSVYSYSAQSGISTINASDPPDIDGMIVETYKTLGDNTKAIHMLVGTATATTVSYACGVRLTAPQNVSQYVTVTNY